MASVLFPVNFVLLDRPTTAPMSSELLDVCAERNIAVQTIKSIAKGRWHDGLDAHFSWYEPLTDPSAIDRAVRYVLSDPRLFLNTTSDARLLPLVVAAASGDLTSPSDAELRADVAEYGITPLFDNAALERI